MLPKDFLHHEIAFVLWMLAGLIGLGVFAKIALSHPASSWPALQIVGLAVFVVAVIASIPHAPSAFRLLGEITTPRPKAVTTLLREDRVVDGIPLKAGATVSVMPDGTLQTAELPQPQSINGLNVVGPIHFKQVHSYRNSELETWFWFGKVAAPQAVPNTVGVWCSPNRPITMEGKSLVDCELARPLSRDGFTFPAGSLIKYGDYSWTVELPDDAGPVLVEGIAVPGGWTVDLIHMDQTATLSMLSGVFYAKPALQDWVEVGGVRLSGPIVFDQEGPWVRGHLWQDETVDGVARQKGDSVRLPHKKAKE